MAQRSDCEFHSKKTSSSSDASKKFEDILKDIRNFPSFSDLPLDVLPDSDHCEIIECDFHYKRTWCFLAEITNDEMSQVFGFFGRNRIAVKDRTGYDNIPIVFYPKMGYFDFKTLKKGCTVAVLFAERHHFLDGTIGLRIENLDTIKVLECNLKELFGISSRFKQAYEVCWNCLKVPSGELKKCGQCYITRYCCKQCQIDDWKKSHKKECKVMKYFIRLTEIDFSKNNPNSVWDIHKST